MKRPSLNVLQHWQSNSSSIPDSHASSQAGSTYTVSQAVQGESTAQFQQTRRGDSEAAFMEQISLMRAAHEAHLSSLREAHEREIESHKSYISILEKRRVLPQSQSDTSKQALALDTTNTSSMAAELTSADASATTLRSWGSSLDNQKRVSQEAAADAEALKRKLSLYRKAVAESGDIRRERDQLRDAAERGDRRIVQLKDIVRKAKDHEKSLKNAVTDLEARLVLANNERTDVLEGFHEACETVRKLTRREQTLTSEVEGLRGRLFYSSGRHASDTTLALPNKNTLVRPKHTRTTSDVRGLAQSNDPLVQQLRDVTQLVSARDGRIRQLEQEVSKCEDTTIADEYGAREEASQRYAALEAKLREQQQMLEATQADCERYNSILHNELRRQSRYAVQQPHGVTLDIDAQALVEAKERARVVMQSDGVLTADLPTDSGPASLERELEYCIKEIILYKLDIKGYKKDLKKAQAQQESLQPMNIRRPLTPDRDSASSIMSNASSERRHPAGSERSLRSDGYTASGLGIHLFQPPQTPTRSLASVTGSALMSTTPPIPPAVLSPPSRPSTPLSSHKRLPRPPASRTPSPLPAQTPSGARLQRGETLRSLSESIISSYAKRGGTPDQGSESTPPARERSSDPPRALGAMPAVPGTTKS
ncbi:hypothetical protein LTR85_010631 [Meristemomyces frigidus]|nr:hypothetical protein LTR85_010631 [Meristemomyces frigidus]